MRSPRTPVFTVAGSAPSHRDHYIRRRVPSRSLQVWEHLRRLQGHAEQQHQDLERQLECLNAENLEVSAGLEASKFFEATR